MKNLLKFLAGPGWLVSAFVLGFLGSLIARYAGRCIDALAARAAASHKDWRRVRREREEGRVKRLAADGTMLTVEWIKLAMGMVGVCFLVLFALAIWAVMMRAPEDPQNRLYLPMALGAIFAAGVLLGRCSVYLRVLRAATDLYSQRQAPKGDE